MGKNSKKSDETIGCLVLVIIFMTLILGPYILSKKVSKEEFNKVNQELINSKIKVEELNDNIKNLNANINRLEKKEKDAEVWFELDQESRDKIKVELEKAKEQKRLEEQKKIEEERKKEEEIKRQEEIKKQEEVKRQEEAKEQQVVSNSNTNTGNGGSSSSNKEETGKHVGKSVYVANGNRYYHAISNCKYLEGAAASVVTLTSGMGKFECNCWTNPVVYKKPVSSGGGSSSNSSSSGGRTVYVASGNSYYHGSPSCKFLQGASANAVGINNVGGKHACNCVKY